MTHYRDRAIPNVYATNNIIAFDRNSRKQVKYNGGKLLTYLSVSDQMNKNKTNSRRNTDYVKHWKATSRTVYLTIKEQYGHSLLPLFKYSVFHFYFILMSIWLHVYLYCQRGLGKGIDHLGLELQMIVSYDMGAEIPTRVLWKNIKST